MIAAKLSDGVTISVILDSVRDSIEKIDRTALVCQQDIRHQYNIAGTKLHKNDHRSVSLWVESMRDQANNDGNDPILVFKQQSHEQPSDIDDMSKNDFLIGIQTSFQRDMLVRFGPTAICMDSTHSTNAYDFFLITILVLDDLSEGIRIAWIISNREDAATIRQVLVKMKEKCGDIHTQFFMSDKVFERVLKTQKGKTTHRLSEIDKRHKAIDKMKESSQITPLNDTSWKVDSSNSQ